jgi:hypothetical protein
MMRRPLLFATSLALLNGCATIVHGPYQDVQIVSNPPGATATITTQGSQRGPNFKDDKKQVVTTPAVVRLQRDNDYRVEMEKPGYKLATTQIVSEYDWLWGQYACGGCEAVGALPTYDVSEANAPMRFWEAVIYEYPVGFFRAAGRSLRILSPDALLGSSFKLKQKDSGYFEGWTALNEPVVGVNLEPN